MTRLRTKAALGLALAALVFAGGRQLLGSFAPHSAGHPPPPSSTSQTSTASSQQLAQLIISDGRPPTADYTRTAYGQAWSDDVSVSGGHNGCDTRNDILRRDAVTGTAVLKAGTHNCKVVSGKWISPYTGQPITQRSQVQIDHVVPLAESWRSGAYAWTADQRRNFANDPAELLAVDGQSNQAKSDKAPEEWTPTIGRCRYAQRWVTVKRTYRLSVTTAERAALTDLLRTC